MIRTRIAGWLRRVADRVEPQSKPFDFEKVARITALTCEMTQADWDALGESRHKIGVKYAGTVDSLKVGPWHLPKAPPKAPKAAP